MNHPTRSSLVPLLLCTALAAQHAESESGLVAMHQARLDANSGVVVLNVAAHPDDESSRTNTMLRRKHGMHIVQVYSTYGDGGQNAIGREIGPELAKIRVRETLRAAAMSGADVRWLGMPDFGFSKTREETLKFWGAEELKNRMRRVFDEVDPDVVITNHTLDRGHGHHRASIWAAIELLKERAEAGRYVPRLYARCGVDTAQLSFATGELDPARGETYARLAWNAWTQHESQGPWGEHDPLRVGSDYWRVVYPEGVSDADAGDLGQWGVRASGGVRMPDGPNPLANEADGDVALFPSHDLPDDFDRMQRADQLAAARRACEWAQAHLTTLSDGKSIRAGRRHAEALQRLYLALSNVRAEVWLEREDVPRGGVGKGFVVLHGHERVTDVVVRCGDRVGAVVRKPVQQTPFDDRPRRTPAVPRPGVPQPTAPQPNGPVQPGPGPQPQGGPPGPGAAPADDEEGSDGDDGQAEPLPGRYEFTFDCSVGSGDELPSGPEPSFAVVDVKFVLDGETFVVTERLPYTPVDPVELKFDREVVLVPKGQKSERLLSVVAESHLDAVVTGPVQLQMGPGISATSTPSRLTLTEEQQEARILLRASIDAEEMTPDAGLAIGFANTEVRLPLRLIDVTVPDGLDVALVRGPEDSTERTLADLGIPFTNLDRDALVSTNLEPFSVVLLDIRAYHHRPELAEVRERLQQYCRAGGRVVSMYHKPREWNARDGHPLLAPFALTIGNERVTEEDAKVTILNPQHRLMTHPHTIGEADFDDWVQERGLNFPRTWDTAWESLLAMKDTGDENAHEGPLLYTQYGRGDFVYCSLSLYRQLRRGNPGAVRLLVNLLTR